MIDELEQTTTFKLKINIGYNLFLS